MKITTIGNGQIQIEELFNGVVLKNDSGETLEICMRDSGFEFRYNNKNYFAKDGYLEPFHVSPRGNEYISSMQHHENDICACNEVKRRTGTPHSNRIKCNNAILNKDVSN
jgi:hypothetical protein